VRIACNLERVPKNLATICRFGVFTIWFVNLLDFIDDKDRWMNDARTLFKKVIPAYAHQVLEFVLKYESLVVSLAHPQERDAKNAIFVMFVRIKQVMFQELTKSRFPDHWRRTNEQNPLLKQTSEQSSYRLYPLANRLVFKVHTLVSKTTLITL
jgi:hypothetical protein